MIVLTGSSGGIGKSLIPYLEKIDKVIGVYYRNKPDANENNNVQYVELNLLDQDAIKLFVSQHKKKFTNITLLHGAAVKIDQLSIHYNEQDWDKVIDVNLKSNYLLTKEMLPLMIEQNWGRIIGITSTGAMRGGQGILAYSASKSGLSGMTRVYAKEYARFNITANLLSLGYFECGLYDELTKEVKANLINEIPSKVLGNVENISHAVDFLIKSGYTNGATINIDGGI